MIIQMASVHVTAVMEQMRRRYDMDDVKNKTQSKDDTYENKSRENEVASAV